MEKTSKGGALAWYESPELRLVRLSRVGTDTLFASGTEDVGDGGLGSWDGGVTGGGGNESIGGLGAGEWGQP